MPKGLCCMAARAGDLGKTLKVDIHNKMTGAIIGQRCGVCEIGPTCKNPQVLGFRFRFLASEKCGLPGKCMITPAYVTQYNANRTEAAGHPVYQYNGTGKNIITPYTPPDVPIAYTLPPS
jgi:hypothetical protein